MLATTYCLTKSSRNFHFKTLPIFFLLDFRAAYNTDDYCTYSWDSLIFIVQWHSSCSPMSLLLWLLLSLYVIPSLHSSLLSSPFFSLSFSPHSHTECLHHFPSLEDHRSLSMTMIPRPVLTPILLSSRIVKLQLSTGYSISTQTDHVQNSNH